MHTIGLHTSPPLGPLPLNMSDFKTYGVANRFLPLAELARTVATSYIKASGDRNIDRSVGGRISKVVQDLQTLADQQQDLNSTPLVIQSITNFISNLEPIREELERASKQPTTSPSGKKCDTNDVKIRLQRIEKDVSNFYQRLLSRGIVLAGLESYKMQGLMASLQTQVKDLVMALKDDPKRAEELLGIKSMTEPQARKALAATRQHLQRPNIPRIENIFLTQKVRLLEGELDKEKQTHSPTTHPPQTVPEDAPPTDRDIPENPAEGQEDPVLEAIQVTRLLQEKSAAMPLEELADSLRRLGLALAKLSWDVQALTVVEWEIKAFQVLAHIGPLAYEKMLPVSLNRLSRCLQKLGDKCGALQAMEEAVTICRNLARGSQSSHRLELGMSLLNLSVHLEDVGQTDHASQHIDEALNLYRAILNTPTRTSRRTLASDLRYLSARLCSIGRKEDATKVAIESTKLYWSLARDDPDAFMQHYGQSLVELGGHFGDAGRNEDALTAIQEAVAVYREMAYTQPAVFLSHLATSLTSSSVYFGHTNHKENAVKAAEEAVAILRTLVEGDLALRPTLAQSLDNLSNCLRGVGRKEESLAATKEAAKIRRRLSRQQTADRQPQPSTSLG